MNFGPFVMFVCGRVIKDRRGMSVLASLSDAEVAYHRRAKGQNDDLIAGSGTGRQ